MCSQPPRDVKDGWIVDDIMAAIPMIDRVTPEILFTGGEPTLLDDKLVDLARQAKSYLPETGLHILTNGRAFNWLQGIGGITCFMFAFWLFEHIHGWGGE
jgi:MoaA/NifB/PqqE/SkfB family radical SAM enzyme